MMVVIQCGLTDSDGDGNLRVYPVDADIYGWDKWGLWRHRNVHASGGNTSCYV